MASNILLLQEGADLCYADYGYWWGPLNVEGRVVKRVWMDSFNYAKLFEWQIKYRYAVDNYNNLDHDLKSIEGTWQTDHWLAVSSPSLLSYPRYFLPRNLAHCLQDQGPQDCPQLY